MESFDQSLKHLLQHDPADFIRFGLGDPTVEVIGPLPSGLPSRGRECTLPFGPRVKKNRSQSAYIRVNLRSLSWQQLLAHGPPPLSGRSSP